MGYLRKYGLTVLALSVGLCALAAAAVQQRTIHNLTAQLTEIQLANESLTERVETAEEGLAEAKEKLEETMPTVRFEHVQVDTASRMLTMDVIVEGAQGAELPNHLYFCFPGESCCLAWREELLQRQADGRTLFQTVTVPLDLEAGLELRLSDDIVLFSSDSMVSLLPLQLSGGGASWHYDSREKMLYLCDYFTSFRAPSGQETEAVNGAFCVYRNGERVFTGWETAEAFLLDADGEQVDGMRLACAPGDHMRLTYTCDDTFGMHYEFPIKEQVALTWDDMRDYPLSHTPTVTWPE